MMNKIKKIITLIFISTLIFDFSYANTINLGGALNLETKLKGEKFKEFFTDHSFIVSRGSRNILFRFKGKVYVIIENNSVVQKGTWKMNMLRNHVRLKPYKGAKSIYLSKLKDKPILFQYNKRPGLENTIRTTYKITDSNKKTILKQVAKFKDGTARGYDIAMEKKKKRATEAMSNMVSSALGVAGNFGGQFGSTSEVTHYFFQASGNYLQALEFLYRAYDNNTEADKIYASIEYMQNSKISETERLQTTKLIIDKSSTAIKSNIQNATHVFSEVGRTYYEKALPFALAATESTINLYVATSNAVNNINNSGGSVEAFFSNIQDVGAIAQVLPEIPGFVKNMNNTVKLVFSGAKEKKIRDNGNLNKKLAELDLDFE